MGYEKLAPFAKALKTDISRVSRWETGDDTPSPIYQHAICKLLDCGLEMFKPEENPPVEAEGIESRRLRLVQYALAIKDSDDIDAAIDALKVFINEQDQLRFSTSV